MRYGNPWEQCRGADDVLITADLSWDENLVAHEKWCNDLAVKFLCIFVLDRFGDFVSDQVCSLWLCLTLPSLTHRTL